MKDLKHPNIPEIFDVEKDDEFTYIIEQYIPGVSLKELCKYKILSQKEIFQFIIQISSTIDYLHSLPKKIIHLDIKPENIIVYENQCYIIDFGNARACDSEETVYLGSPSYAAPEQFSGEGTTIESDIYSLGKLLLYLINHGNLSKKEFSEFEKIANSCIKKRFWNRIGTAEEFINRLTQLQKKTKVSKEEHIRLAVAGAAENTGATYISLIISAFLTLSEGTSAYVETKDSNIWEYTETSRLKQELPGMKYIDSKQYEKEMFPDCSLTFDFGLIGTDMPKGFYEADCVCIVLGKMAWEKADLIRSRALSQKCKNRIFLVNLTDSVPDTLALFLKGEKFAAIPFINKPEDIIKDKSLTDIFSDIISKCRKD